jgi:hypothetical protein
VPLTKHKVSQATAPPPQAAYLRLENKPPHAADTYTKPLSQAALVRQWHETQQRGAHSGQTTYVYVNMPLLPNG